MNLFGLVYQVDTDGSKGGCKEVVPLEGFAEEKAGGQGADYGDEGVENGHFSHGVTADEFVVDGKSDCGDGYQGQEYCDAGESYSGQGSSGEKSGQQEKESAYGEGVSGAHKDIHAFAQASGHQAGYCGAHRVEENHSVAHPAESAIGFVAEIQGEDACYSYGYAYDFLQGEFVAFEEEAGKDYQDEGAH